MNDQEFLRAFEQHTLTEFPHQSHIRMAWLYLRAYGPQEGQARIQQGIQDFAAAQGATRKYHQTITIFWSRLVQHVIDTHPDTDDFESVLTAFPPLLNPKSISAHYSAALLQSETARHAWVEPDLQPMP